MAESFIHDQVAQHLERNEQLIATIEQHGGDIDEERQIDFFFYANSREDAVAMAADLEAFGFEAAHAGEEPYEDKWPVQAIRNDSVANITAVAFVENLVRLTAKYLADFDGWGTAV